jgi:ribosomal protein L4
MLAAFSKNFSGLTKRKNAALIALPSRNLATIKSFRNFGNVAVEEVRNLNPLSVLSAKYLVIASPKDAFDTIAKKSAK